MREEYLLAALRMGAGTDPVPEGVSAAARAVFALRVPGGVPAGPVDLAAPAGARSASGPPPGGVQDGHPAETSHADTSHSDTSRVRRFSADGLTIDVETTVNGGRMEVAGQVSPVPGPQARIEVRTPHISKIRELSETGHFAVAGLPPGWVSVVCHRPGHASVFTRWVHVRP